MRKKLIALAAASLVSAPVFAQSTVSVYGVVDQAIDSGNYGGTIGSVTRLTSSGYSTERLGFKGSEDLGNGMKANFVLEMGMASDVGKLDNANNQLFNRQSFVGLSGNWGSVNFGRQYTPVFSIQAANDIFNIAGIGSAYSLTNSGMTRANNAIRYDSASINGFSGAAMYSMGDAGNANNNQENIVAANPKDQGRHTGLNLRYANGPLAVGLGWANQKNTGVVAPATVVATKTTALIGSYDFKVVAINAGWQTSKNDASPVTFDNRIWTLGATVPVFGNDSVKVSYNSLKDKLVSNDDSKVLSLGYVHRMSKRTTIYGTWAKMTNDSGAARVLGAGLLGGAPGTGALGYDPSSVQVGVSHNF